MLVEWGGKRDQKSHVMKKATKEEIRKVMNSGRGGGTAVKQRSRGKL